MIFTPEQPTECQCGRTIKAGDELCATCYLTGIQVDIQDKIQVAQPQTWEDELAELYDENDPVKVRDFVRKLLLSQHDQLKIRYDGEITRLRKLEVEAMESSSLVVDRMYHKGKVHLIDDLLELLTKKE